MGDYLRLLKKKVYGAWERRNAVFGHFWNLVMEEVFHALGFRMDYLTLFVSPPSQSNDSVPPKTSERVTVLYAPESSSCWFFIFLYFQDFHILKYLPWVFSVVKIGFNDHFRLYNQRNEISPEKKGHLKDVFLNKPWSKCWFVLVLFCFLLLLLFLLYLKCYFEQSSFTVA